MLQRLHDRKIRKLVESVKIYAGQNYTDPFQPSVSASDQEIPSEVDQRDPSRFRFSFSQPEEENEESSEEQRRRSIAASAGKHRNRSRKPHHRDRYNSRYIQSAVRSLSDGNPPSSVMRELEDNTDMSFVDKMLWLINEKHLRDSNVYKAAEVDRRLWSKIVSDRSYKPAKDTCIALSLAMRLSLSEANDLLSRAGYVLSHSNKRDVIIEYFFRENIYRLSDVNEILFCLDQKTLGR